MRYPQKAWPREEAVEGAVGHPVHPQEEEEEAHRALQRALLGQMARAWDEEALRVGPLEEDL